MLIQSGPCRPLRWLPFARSVEEGCLFPTGHGLAWRDYSCNRTVTLPVPFNLVAGYLRDCWIDLTCPKALRDDVWGAGEHHAAFVRGMDAGRAFAARGR